jgi:hypothetical protein
VPGGHQARGVGGVFKDGLAGRGGDGKQGRLIEKKWHCKRHAKRLQMRARK